jgi:gamma-glutamyltranspeptidase/glutathione hydrolase
MTIRSGSLALILVVLATRLASAQTPDPDPTFAKHVVVAQERHAADVGRDILRQGGNAVDAAVATAFALAVTLPEAGNLGGGGFIVAYSADRRTILTFDFRETAPKASTERMYLDETGKKPQPHHRAGARAAGVPGTVRGLGLAHSTLGKLPWSDLVKPAAWLARDGFAISDSLARSLNAQLHARRKTSGDLKNEGAANLGADVDHLADFPDSVVAYGKPDGTLWRGGDRLIQPDLAATLDRIGSHGSDEFYTGKTAELIANYSATHNGLITRDDLTSYKAMPREPVHTTFRGHDVYGMGPSASGGIVLAEMLNILENFDLKADGPRSARTLHRVTEAMRRAYFTRASRIADPDFFTVPTAQLTSKSYANRLAKTITERATPSTSLAPFPVSTREGDHTTHLSALDSSGNAVALTYTLEEGYGSKAVVAGAGFLLNNEMGDFNLIPGLTDTSGRIGTTPNLIAPGKRMLSSQCPTIILKDGKVRLVTGSPGGRTIPNTVLWIVLNILEFEMEPRAAVDAPRTHHAWFPDVLSMESRGRDDAVNEALRAMGHRVKFTEIQGDAQTIVVDQTSGRIHGVADRRRKTEYASGD